MITVDKSTEIVLGDKRFCRKINFLACSVFFLNVGLMILCIPVFMAIVKTRSEFVSDVYFGSWAVLLFASFPIGYRIMHLIGKRYSKKFLSELSVSGFKCDKIFDVGAITHFDESSAIFGGDAVVAVDYSQRLVAIMFYNNPNEPYIIPAGLISDVWSGRNDDDTIERAAFGFKVNETEIMVPSAANVFTGITKRCKREDYLNGNVSKKFLEAVEKADEFAAALKKLTGMKH